MKRPFAILLPAICIALAAGAQVPLRMDVETSEARTRYLDVYRGETVAMELAFRSYGEPLAFADGTPATVYWQTNGMDAAWWTAPATTTTNGLVSAAWTPAMDCGAERYSLFVGVGDASRMYRASFQVRMRGAPGYPANPLPLPVEVLDFAAVAWTNAPWALPDDISNIVDRAYIEGLGISGGGGIASETDPSTGITNGHVFVRGVRLVTNGWINVPGAIENATFDSGNTPLIAKYFDKPLWLILLELTDANETQDESLNTLSGRMDGTVRTSHTGNVNIDGALSASKLRVGFGASANGEDAFSVGWGVTASGDRSIALGYGTTASNSYSFAWQGRDPANGFDPGPYGSHGPGTFSINPSGGANGMWIGDVTLAQTVRNLAPEPDLSGYVAKAKKELHADCATNIVWMNVYSNGWAFLIPVTNVLEYAE